MQEQIATYPLASVLTFLRRRVDQTVGAWHCFWFAPLDPLMLGIIRVLTGWMLFYNLLTWSLQLESFFGRNGLQPLETVKRLYQSGFVFSFWLWIDDQYLWPVHIGCIIVSAMFCLGAATRLTSILAFLITISYSQRVPVANFGFDQILGMMCLYLALAPCGASVSLDRMIVKWWRRRKGLAEKAAQIRLPSARMASRLIQLHMCAIYFWAGFSKLKGPTWWTGEAMWNVIANQEYQTLDLTWMAQAPWLPFLIAHVTIAWEAFFIVLVWNRRLRPFVLGMGTIMHLGIGAFLGMWTFGLIMTFAYLAFADPETWRLRFSRLSMRLFPGLSVGPSGVAAERMEMDDTTAIPGSDLPCLSSPILAASTLITDVPPTSACVQHPKTVASQSSVLVIAADSQHRSALREHFRGHEFDCRAVDSRDRALNLVHRQPFSAIVIHGSGYLRADLLSLTSDIVDYADVPVLVLLAGRQNTLKALLRTMPDVECRALPASLRDIRQDLESMLSRCGNRGT